MDIPLIFTIIFVLTTTIFFFISYYKYKYRIDNPILPPCLKSSHIKQSNEALCKNLNIKKLDKSIYVIVPVLIGLCTASIFCLIYVLI
jgi:hypothetical protein